MSSSKGRTPQESQDKTPREDDEHTQRQRYIQQRLAAKAAARQTKREQKAAIRQQEVTLMPKLSVLFGFLLGPVGALLGHIWLAWTKDELTYDDNGTVLRSRRYAWVAVFVGWFMTAILVVVGTGWYTTHTDRQAQAALASQIEQEQAQLREHIVSQAETSTSVGAVDAGLCEVLVEDVYAASPTTFGILNDYGLITDEALAAYGAAASDTVETPHSELYAGYREYLEQFDSLEDFAAFGAEAHVEQADPVANALNEDILACVDLDEQYLDTLLDVQYGALEQ